MVLLHANMLIQKDEVCFPLFTPLEQVVMWTMLGLGVLFHLSLLALVL